MTLAPTRVDVGTLLLLVALGLIGVLAVASATHDPGRAWFVGAAGKQLAFLALGVLVYYVVQRVDYHDWAGAWVLLYLGGLLLLGALLLVARPIAGARSWFELGPVRLQPSEPMKAVVCLSVASFLGEVTGKLDFSRLLKVGALVGLPVLLVAIQPDLGTAITFIPLFVAIVWLAGIRPRVLVSLAVVAALAAPVAWFVVLQPYQKDRIRTVFDPSRDPSGTGYQVIQSRIAIGSGGPVGKGLLHGSQSRLDFLPAQETDFVLAVLAEETGFVGVTLVLALYAALLLRAIGTASVAQDHLGMFLALGVAALWAGQIFINAGMVTGVLPTIGVPLPVLSYGGSSTVATFLAFGLVGSVRSGRFVNA
ncbi:MAG: rod shape-determining protein RodA [Acidobacteriota bacterium]|nr:rod shape-determining protein RodA [Acidobacteriota bacterium]